MVPHFKFKIYTVIIFLALCCQNKTDLESINIDKKQNKADKKILMVGNSFTFYWNLPQVLERMFATKDFRIEVDQKTIGGSSLSEHWDYNLHKR